MAWVGVQAMTNDGLEASRGAPRQLTTGLAHEGLLAGVNADVVVQGRHLLEGSPTVGAAVRLVVRVVEHVLVVALLEGEGLATLCTRVRCLSCCPRG